MIQFFTSLSTDKRIYKPDTDGNYSPFQNPLIDTYKNISLIPFICYGMAPYSNVASYATRAGSALPAPSTFAPPADILTKIEGWVQFCADSNAEAAIFTAMHNDGFCLFPYNTQFNGGNDIQSFDETRGIQVTRPQYKPYAVNHSSIVGSVPQNMVETFVNKCRQVNIEPILYFNMGKNLNAQWAHTRPTSAYDETGNYDDYYADWYANGYDFADTNYPTFTGTYASWYREFQNYQIGIAAELVRLTDCTYYWMDSPYTYPRAGLQAFYNEMKKIRDVVLIYNNLTVEVGETVYPNGTKTEPTYDFNGDLYLYPSDVASIEQQFAPTNPNEFGDTLRPWRGQNYYIPGELGAATGSPTYFYTNPFTVKNQSTVQGYYDLAKSQNVAAALSLSPDSNGDLVQAQKDLFTNLVR